jgi:hypothetical protein
VPKPHIGLGLLGAMAKAPNVAHHRDPKVDAALAALPAEVQEIAARLRALVETTAPDLVEQVKWGNPVWVGRGNVVVLMLFPQHLNFGFFRGSELTKKFPLLEGTGKGMRHVKVRSLAATEDPVLAQIVREAVRLDRVRG